MLPSDYKKSKLINQKWDLKNFNSKTYLVSDVTI